MPTLRACFAAAAGLAGLAHAAEQPGPKVVGFEIAKSRRQALATLARRNLARRDTVSASLTNFRSLYQINVTVGTPPQQLGLQIDTGSSDVWFPYAGSSQCMQGGCESAFDPDQSSTFEDIGQGQFKIQYVDGTTISGDYARDVLSIGNTEIRNMTMAVATDSDDTPEGIMGVGFVQDETLAQSDNITYPNVPVQLVQQGFINSVAYSLWLNDLDSSSGNVLFGGVDSDKYDGDLIGLPIQPDSQSGSITSFTVAMSSLNIKAGGGNSVYSQSNLDLPAILDSGTTLTLLPDSIANEIIQGVGARNSQDFGYVVNCSIGTTGAAIEFGFGGSDGPTISVGMDEMVLPITDDEGRPARFRGSGEEACTFGIEPAGSAPILLGDTFMRSAYVVYDLHNNQIALANTKFNATSSNIQEITNTTIPGVSKVASSLTVTQTATGPIRESGGLATGGASATAEAGTGTFNLGSTSTAGSSSKKGAAVGLPAPRIALETVMCGIVVVLSAMFGGSLMILI
ncbi:putative aspartic-type endopeptidase protein [Neofusicoccum parvum UCRNP2]|uniref:Putative aspartic-type endopeptidase protein n=1 Tax=Botryosphaeria parva (strain UCR-NP2) TaxID=1287680 RepID=R1GWG9_BOTPV|nr:putative aspartic-type endopeptidase protein [Neofusicoccum parvum UCRNP2]